METENKQKNISPAEQEITSRLLDEGSHAFELIRQGKEKEAKEKFPMEHYFIRKYVSSGLDELKELLSLKLRLH